MNRRLLLNLFTLPTIVGSAFCWLSALPAHALESQEASPDAAPVELLFQKPISSPQALPPNSKIIQQVSEPDPAATEAQFCVMSQHSRFNLVCEKVTQLKASNQTKPIDYATHPFTSPLAFEFTDEESNAAIALFGCDCPLCLNSLRSLRTMSQPAG